MMRGRGWVLVIGLAVAGLGVGGVAGSPARAAPAGYPVTGIDVSAYQGQVDWASVAAGGPRFAYVRASEQSGLPDSYFTANYQGARGNGLYVGAYHRARPDLSSGKAQADFFIDHAGYVTDGKTLPPMLDIEWPRANWTGLNACYNMTAAQMSAWIRDFVTEVARRTGQRAMIYTNTNWWNPCTASNATFGSYPLFIAGYTATPPPLPAGWATWTFWQYSDSGTLPGDQDVFSGDPVSLTRLAGAPPVSLRAHANGRYVTADNAGRSPLIANRTAIGAWEKFRLVVNPDGSTSLLANANSRYVTAANAGGSALIANRTAIGAWEQFDQVVPSAVISLLAGTNGRYVTADNAGRSPLIANRTAIGPWEKFRLAVNSDGSISLLAAANGRYVTADNAGRSPLIANGTAIGAGQKFYRTPSGR